MKESSVIEAKGKRSFKEEIELSTNNTIKLRTEEGPLSLGTRIDDELREVLLGLPEGQTAQEV